MRINNNNDNNNKYEVWTNLGRVMAGDFVEKKKEKKIGKLQ